MDSAATPDNWDQDEASDGDTSKYVEPDHGKFSNLNVTAPSFVPGKNVMAAAFVPGAGKIDINNEPTPTLVPVVQAALNTEESGAEWSATKETQNLAEPDNVNVKETPQSDAKGEEREEETFMEATQVAKKKKEVVVFTGADKKEHVNIVFIGHVDAGKSTIGGRVLQATGMVDQRTLEKFEREAKEKNRETWYLSWALDTNVEERDKGKTVEVGRAYFETEKRHFTILDAPGHKSFVPNMIGGASQADIAVLVISARKGEFETGFERGGQTREHAMLVKTAGVKYLIILINKMDDPTVRWDEARFTECRDKLLPYLKKIGFNTKKDAKCIPCSGLTGAFIKYRPAEPVEWYTGPTFLEYLESIPTFNRASEGPVRIPIVDRYKDMGTIALGKVESGQIILGQKLLIMPNRKETEVMSIWTDDIESDGANTGVNVKIKLKNVEEEDVQQGFVLCSPLDVCQTGRVFDAHVVVLEHKSIICAGYSAILHLHTCIEEITLKVLISQIDKRTGEKIKRPRFIKQDQVAIVRFELNGGIVCMERYEDFPQMGRFTLRDEGKTVAVGKVLKIVE